jgi:hypothetical protein
VPGDELPGPNARRHAISPSQDASFLVESYALSNAGVWDEFQKFVAKETKILIS